VQQKTTKRLGSARSIPDLYSEGPGLKSRATTVHRDLGYLWYSELRLMVGFGIGVGPSCWLLLRSERGAKSLPGKNFILHGLYATVMNVKQWLNITHRHIKVHKNDMITPNPDNIPKCSLLFEKQTTYTFNPNCNWTRFNFSQVQAPHKSKVHPCTGTEARTGRTAHRGSIYIALPFLDHSTRRGWGVSVTPRALFIPGKDSVPIE